MEHALLPVNVSRQELKMKIFIYILLFPTSFLLSFAIFSYLDF